MARASGTRGKDCDNLILEKISGLNSAILQRKDITLEDLEDTYKKAINYQTDNFFKFTDGNGIIFMYGVLLMVILFIATPALVWLLEYTLSTRCFVGNNYLVWEATRPISDCNHCRGLKGPIILPNMTKEDFKPYAYSSKPIIIKGAIAHWDAVKNLNYTFLKDLYLRIPGAMESVHKDCQFLHFKSNFMTLADVFQMSEDRVNNVHGEEPWYVGWSNCHPLILQELRKLYPVCPHFLPEDAELPNTDFVFLGYEQGAIMHVSSSTVR